ncbi:SH3 domain-binding protein 5-like [Neosynchiropus ocellatus]
MSCFNMIREIKGNCFEGAAEDSSAMDALDIINPPNVDCGKHEEELDPRIQVELEHLNQAGDDINQLELQLDDAHSSYRRILTDTARSLNAQASQLGTCIDKARPYYEARRRAKEASHETQKAALRYERAVSMHTAAREMVYVAEQGLLADRNTMDPTWQEMLNHATTKVNQAEEERLHSEHEHQRVTQLCQEAEASVQSLQKSLKKVILKSKPYFELKAQFNQILEEHKAKVVHLEEQVAKGKTRYSVALRNLEQISEQIHAHRGRAQVGQGGHVACVGRSSPVGAEAQVGDAAGSHTGNCEGVSGVECDWADGERTRLWVEKHRQNGWGHRKHLVQPSISDCISVVSLLTIASDLEKCDSVEHLGDLSESGSMGEPAWARFRSERSRPLSRVEMTTHQEEEGEALRQKKTQRFVKQLHRSATV